MRSAWILAAAIAAAGCYDPDIRDPEDFSPAKPIADEPSLGPLLLEGSQLRETLVSSMFKNASGYVYIYEGAGWDKDLHYVAEQASFFTVDPDTGEGVLVEGPPLAPQRTHQFGVMFGEGALLLVGRRAPEQGVDAAVYLDGAWTVAPGPDGVDVSQIASGMARSASEIVIVTRSSVPWMFDGSTWRTLNVPGGNNGTVVAGPWDASGLRLVHAASTQQICSLFYSPAIIGSGGAPTAQCADVASEPSGGLAGTAINGTVDDFQVLAKVPGGDGLVRLVRFVNGTGVIGRSFAGSSLISAPGSAFPVVAAVHPGASATGYFPSLLATDAGQVGAKLVEGGFVRTACACSRATDPDCACFARDAVHAQSSVNAAATRNALVLIDDVDGRRKVHVRVLALPFQGTPFAALPCDITCPADHVCLVDPISGSSRCTMEDAGEMFVGAHHAVTTIDPSLDPTPELVLTSPDPNCSATFTPGLSHPIQLDPHCSYTLDATATGHVPLHVEGIVTTTESQPLYIGPYTLGRGGLLATTDVSSAFFDPTLRLTVAPPGGRMIVAVEGSWLWVAGAQTAPGFTVTPLIAAPLESDGPFPPANPRFVGDTRALVHSATQGLHLIVDGAVTATIADVVDLSRGAFAHAASVAVFPSGTSAGPLGVSSGTTLVQYAGSTLSVVASSPIEARGHAIRADGGRAAFFNSNGSIVFLDAATGTTTVGASPWANATRLRVALGPGDDHVVVVPTGSNACVTSLCLVFAREDIPGDPGDPVVRQLVQMTDRARWAEIGTSVGHVAWLRLDAQNLAHLYHRNTTTRVTTEIPMGPSIPQDIAHVAIGDKLLVVVPTGIIVVDLATGAFRMEPGAFNSANSVINDPLLRVGDDGRVFLAEACVMSDPCGMWIYDPSTDTFTRLAQSEVARFGIANDRALTGLVVSVINAAGTVLRMYGIARTPADIEPTFRSARARGAPCVVYWHAVTATSTTRRWHCSD